ncbi:MAG TPA: DUF4337 domain-containing protein [Terriglobales bacterium]
MSEDQPVELQELHEHAEHTHETPQLLPVTVTISVLAVLVAVVTLMGHRAHTEEVVTQIKAADTWAEYQAKNIRYHNDGSFADVVSILPGANENSAKVREHFRQEAEKYNHEKDDLQTEARKLESEVLTERRKANRYDFGEAMLEMALVITSLTLLTKRRPFWYAGLALGLLGVIVALSAITVH